MKDTAQKKSSGAVRLICAALIGVAIGLGVSWLIVGVISGHDLLHQPAGHDVSGTRIALSIVLCFVFLAVSAVLHTLLHEAGHLVGGLLTGYRFSSFRIFSLALVNDNGRLRFANYSIAGTLGQCLMIPPEGRDPQCTPYFWFNAGGVLSNVVWTVIALLILRFTQPGMAGMDFGLMFVVVGLALALMNGIPASAGGLNNDGATVRDLHRKPNQRILFADMLRLSGALSSGTRPKDMPREWFHEETPEGCSPQDYLVFSSRANLMCLLEDRGELDRARELGEELLEGGERIPMVFRMELCSDVVMLALLTDDGERGKETVERLWTKQVEGYTKSAAGYSATKLAALYAYELLYRRSAETAAPYRERFEQNAARFVMPGEAKVAAELIEKISAQAELLPA